MQIGDFIQGYVIAASPQIIQQRPDAIAAFLKQTVNGVKFAVANPNDAVGSMLKLETRLNAQITRAQWMEAITLIKTPQQTKSYGTIDQQVFANGVKIIMMDSD